MTTAASVGATRSSSSRGRATALLVGIANSKTANVKQLRFVIEIQGHFENYSRLCVQYQEPF
jgi:hypothetical protein